MTADEILFAIISANAGVGALIGAGEACKLYPDEIPQDTPMPAATYCMVVGRPENVMDTSPRATTTTPRRRWHGPSSKRCRAPRQ
jgi:hypothetical protein